MKRVAIDLHDVCIGYVRGLIDKYGWPLTWETPLTNMWPHIPQIEWDMHFREYEHADFLWSLHPIRGAVKGTKALWNSPDWWPLFLTATPGGGREEKITREWLGSYNFDGFEIVFTGSFENKVDWIINNEIDYIIEDHPRVIEPCMKLGLSVVIYSTPWNRHIDTSLRAENWEEVKELFDV